MGEMPSDEAFDRVRRIASIVFEKIDTTYAVYSIIGPRKILMLEKPFTKEIIYTPYGVEYLKLNKNKLPSYYENIYTKEVLFKNKLVSIPYVKGRSPEEIEELINQELNK
jgi:hypothetical protein